MIFFVLLLTLISNCFSRGYIKYTFEPNTYNNLILPVCISKRYNCYPFLLSTAIKETLVLDGNNYMNCFIPSHSKTYEITATTIGKNFHRYYIKGVFSYDTFFVEETDIFLKHFRFILVDKGIYMDNYYGVIGLGNEFSVLSNEGNFIDALVNNGNIDRAVFTVSNTSIVFGTNNETYPDKEKKTQKCKIRTKGANSDLITCEVRSAIINGKEIFYNYNVSALLKIDLERRGINVPKSFYEIIKEKIFKNYLLNETSCKEVENSIFPTYIQCNDEVINEIGEIDIYIFIDKWSIVYSMKELFEGNKFMIWTIKGENEWQFGHFMRDRFTMTVDQKDNLIYFINRN